MVSKIYKSRGTPQTAGDIHRIMHNMKVEIARDLKKNKVKTGIVAFQVSPALECRARYFEDEKMLPDLEGCRIVTVDKLLEHAK